MKAMLIAAAVAALPLAAPSLAAPSLAASGATLSDAGWNAGLMPTHIRIARGQSIQLAIQQARFASRLNALRLARGVGAAQPADSTAAVPALTSGTVVSTSIKVGVAGNNPTVRFSFTSGPAGLAGVTLVFVSPSGTDSLSLNYSPQGLQTQGTVTVEEPGGPFYYAPPGEWQLAAAYLGDYAGNFTSYTQAQLAVLFARPYLEIENDGPVDITPPTVQSGKVLTQEVKLSSPLPVFSATLTGQDSTSGLYEPLVGIEPPGGEFSYIDEAPMPFPLNSGTGTAYSTVYAGAPTGTWTISFYAFCDVVGNCFTYNSPAEVKSLFGTTTFKVTN